MLIARGGTRIAVPAADVFDFLADARNEPTWLPGAADVRLLSDEPIEAGAMFVGQYARAGTVELSITRYEPPTRLTIAGEAKGMRFTDEIELTERDGTTELRAVMTTEPLGAFRVMAPVLRRVIQRQFATNWEHLRTRLERGASA